MHNSFVARGRESLGDAKRVLDHSPSRQRTGFEPLAEPWWLKLGFVKSY